MYLIKISPAKKKEKKNTRTNIYLKIPPKLASLKFQPSTNYLHLGYPIPNRIFHNARRTLIETRKKRKEKTKEKEKSKRNCQVVKLTKRKAC